MTDAIHGAWVTYQLQLPTFNIIFRFLTLRAATFLKRVFRGKLPDTFVYIITYHNDDEPSLAEQMSRRPRKNVVDNPCCSHSYNPNLNQFGAGQ